MDVDGWQSHWLKTYHEPRLVWHRKKWHWAVTKPKELQKKTDKDKKLSSGTTDELVAKQRKWSVVAKIYASFDAQLGDIDPQVARYKAFRLEAVKLFAKYGEKSQQTQHLIMNSFMETDDIVRHLLHQRSSVEYLGRCTCLLLSSQCIYEQIPY